MRLVKKKDPGPVFQAHDRVRTARGPGVIKHVFPSRVRGRNMYYVTFDGLRVGQVFNEGELRLAEKGAGAMQSAGDETFENDYRVPVG